MGPAGTGRSVSGDILFRAHRRQHSNAGSKTLAVALSSAAMAAAAALRPSAMKKSLLLLLGATMALLHALPAEAVRTSFALRERRLAEVAATCPQAALDLCSFYFEGYEEAPPVIDLDGAPDQAVGPALMAKDASLGEGVPAVVASTGEAKSLCGSEASLGNQFYITGQPSYLHIRTFNQPPKSAFESKCVLLPLRGVRVGWLNLNPGDANQAAFPEARRCVVFSTGPSPACGQLSPSAPSPLPSPPAPLPPLPQPILAPSPTSFPISTPPAPPTNLPTPAPSPSDTPSSSPFSAIFAFGDSTLDIGNNNDIVGSPYKVNFLPYDIDYIPASGRFTNGKGFVDLLVELLGLPPVPKYEDANANSSSDYFSAGINFASGGSGVLSTTGCKGDTICFSLSFQVSQFLAASLSYTAEEKATSLFIVSTGGNDYFAYFGNSSAYNITEYVGSVINGLAETFQTLYAAGARKFIVLELPDLGCTPSLLATANASESTPQCLTFTTPLVTAHNAALESLLIGLQQLLPGAYFTRFHAQEYIHNITSNPGSFGLSNGFDACCGGGLFGVKIHCGLPSATVCADRDAYVWWDPLHLTQTVIEDIVKRAVEGDGEYVQPYGLTTLALL